MCYNGQFILTKVDFIFLMNKSHYLLVYDEK